MVAPKISNLEVRVRFPHAALWAIGVVQTYVTVYDKSGVGFSHSPLAEIA